MRVQPAYRFSGQPRFGANDLDNFGMSTKTKVLLGACLVAVAGIAAAPTVASYIDDLEITPEERLEKDLAHFQDRTAEITDPQVVREDSSQPAEEFEGRRYQFEGSDGQVYIITKGPSFPRFDEIGKYTLEQVSEIDDRQVLERGLFCERDSVSSYLESIKVEKDEDGYTGHTRGETTSPERAEEGCNFLVDLYQKVKAKAGR